MSSTPTYSSFDYPVPEICNLSAGCYVSKIDPAWIFGEVFTYNSLLIIRAFVRTDSCI